MLEIQIGSIVSSGTLKTEYLLPAFTDELRRLSPESKLLAGVDARLADLIKNKTEGTLICWKIQEELNSLAPVHVYFGNFCGCHPYFGWWANNEKATMNQQWAISINAALQEHLETVHAN